MVLRVFVWKLYVNQLLLVLKHNAEFYNHAIHKLTHNFSSNMRFIFLVFCFPYLLALVLRTRANKTENKKLEK